jgi:hypothetical protein
MLFLATFTGCKGDGTNGAADSLTEKRVTVERTIRLTEKRDSPFYDIKIDLAYFTPLQDETAKRMNQQIIRYVMDTTDISPKEAVRLYINDLYNEYRSEMLDFYLEDLKENKGNTETMRNYNYAYHLETDVDKGYKGVVCYKMEGYRYSAGAHGVNMYKYFNFDNNGNNLTLADIFETGFEKELLRILVQELMKKFHVTTTEALKEKGVVDVSQLFVTENFELEDDEIEFVYNEYEIAPYCMGAIKVDIDYKDIKHILKEEWR